MSTILVVTPIIIASWPAITAAVSAAISVAGFTVVQQAASLTANQTARSREIIDIEESEILDASVGTDEVLVVEKDGVRATFRRDARGGLQICMEGDHVSKAKLRSMGEELLGKVTQQYAYHRIVTELKNRNMTIVDEHMTETESVKIRIRNW